MAPALAVENRPVIQRDYVLRLIEQAAAALRRALDRGRAGDTAEALAALHEAQGRLLADLGPVASVLSAGSLVELAGPASHDRLAAYARLLAAEARVHNLAGDGISAGLACRRALETWAALRAAGAKLGDQDREQLEAMASELGRGLLPGFEELFEPL